jgi:hypothetical protein
MEKIFRWVDKDNNKHEYRFRNGICLGFFTNDKETHQEQKYMGKKLTALWEENLEMAGFKLQ